MCFRPTFYVVYFMQFLTIFTLSHFVRMSSAYWRLFLFLKNRYFISPLYCLHNCWISSYRYYSMCKERYFCGSSFYVVIVCVMSYLSPICKYSYYTVVWRHLLCRFFLNPESWSSPPFKLMCYIKLIVLFRAFLSWQDWCIIWDLYYGW